MIYAFIETPISTERVHHGNMSSQDVTNTGENGEQNPSLGNDNAGSVENVVSEVAKRDDESKESTPEPVPKPQPTTTKRMSLQERLALAAQKKKKEKSKQVKEKPTPVESSRVESIQETESQPTGNACLEHFSNFFPSDSTEKRDQFTAQLNKYIHEQVSKVENIKNAKIAKLEKELSKAKTAKSAKLPNEESLFKKLQEKEEQISNLLEEGTKLSKRELSLNQTVKKLKSREAELEEELEKSEKSNEEYVSKIEKLENDAIKSDKLERNLVEEKLALETLQRKYDSLVRANESLTDELKEIKFSKLDVHLQSTKKELEEEKQRHEAVKENYVNLDIEFKKFKEENQLVVSELKKELISSQDNNRDKSNEIKRLEEKIEALRFQTENSITTESPSINTDMIQLQYEEAKENWKLIESSYMKKISNFETQLDELQSSNVIYSKKIKILTNDLKQKSADISDNQETIFSLGSEIDSLKKKNTSLVNANKLLESNLQMLKQEFAKERESFQKKVQTLEEEKENVEASLKLRTNEFYSTNQLSQNSFYLQDLSSSSSVNFMKSVNTPTLGRSISSNRRYSSQVGESAVTPRSSVANQSVSYNRLNSIAPMSSQDKILKHQYSMASIESGDVHSFGLNLGDRSASNISDNLTELQTSQNESFQEGNERKQEHYEQNPPALESPYNSKVSQKDFMMSNDEIPLGMDAETERLQGVNGNSHLNAGNSANPLTAGINIQLINKLSAHVRMLELEVSTLRDETKNLEKEKESASQEIVRLIEDNSKVQEVRDEVTLKETEITDLNNNYQRVLVLLGEKEERLGELNADVDDLKDLLRQQVQQMVEMQEKINELNKTT